MTINIAVLTSEALVLGCDSIASTTQYFLDPFQFELQPDADGVATISFQISHLSQQVTNAWDGVTKMFQISKSPAVAAVTAGLAKLDGQTVASLAQQFFSERPREPGPGNTVEHVANDFLGFMREAYERHYEDSKLPDELKDGPLFLVGGYSEQDNFPSLYRVNVQGNRVGTAYSAGDFGVAWEGQSDSVERLLRGYDSNLRRLIESSVKDAISATRETMAHAMAQIIQQVLESLGGELPDDVDTELPEPASISLPWDQFRVAMPYSNLPLQDAVDLVAFFVNLQSGKSKFAHGLATVGGRTHIGIITRHRGFEMLDEPELKHRNVGFQ